MTYLQISIYISCVDFIFHISKTTGMCAIRGSVKTAKKKKNNYAETFGTIAAATK
jgi:hypothetical protein